MFCFLVFLSAVETNESGISSVDYHPYRAWTLISNLKARIRPYLLWLRRFFINGRMEDFSLVFHGQP